LTHDREHFRSSYAGSPPWDIGKPQPAFEVSANKVVGSILDAGCGTGEQALFFAARGHAVTGLDFVEEAVAVARRKAAERNLTVNFLVEDTLKLDEWTERFDNVLDCGLFHVFSDADRIRYVRGLKTVLDPGGRLFLLCFSDATPGTQGPRRVSQPELRDAFADGWEIESIEPVRLEIRPEYKPGVFSEDPHGWFLITRRLA
jgi:cyclopropane fatty-acyl-phospholipid synthase-like methyltransferase